MSATVLAAATVCGPATVWAVQPTVTWDADTATAGVQNGAGLWLDAAGAATTNWWDGSANVAFPSIRTDRGDVIIGDLAATGSPGAVTFGRDSSTVYVGNLTVTGPGWSIGNSATIRSSIDVTGVYTTNGNITQHSALVGTGGLTVNGGTFTPGFRQSLSTFRGPTTINNAVFLASALTNAAGTITSNFGQPTTAVTSGLVLDGATIRLTNVAGTLDNSATTNRLFTLGSGGATIEANGSGTVNFTGTGAVAFTGSGARQLALGGSNTTKTHVLAPAIGDAAVGEPTSLRKAGNSTWSLTGVNTYTGATTVAAGTLRVSGAAGTNLLTNAGGVELTASGAKLVFDYAGGTSPVAAVKAALDASYAGPTPFAAGQIRTPIGTAARGLGYRDDGTGAVTVVYTLYGDADLDGDVDFNDFLSLQTNFGTGGTRFDQGNFDYSAATDFNDFLILQTNFGQSLTGGDVAITAAEYEAVAAFAAAVPEPTSLAVLALVGTGLAARRRGR